jgi:hypothetical protein
MKIFLCAEFPTEAPGEILSRVQDQSVLLADEGCLLERPPQRSGKIGTDNERREDLKTELTKKDGH